MKLKRNLNLSVIIIVLCLFTSFKSSIVHIKNTEQDHTDNQTKELKTSLEPREQRKLHQHMTHHRHNFKRRKNIRKNEASVHKSFKLNKRKNVVTNNKRKLQKQAPLNTVTQTSPNPQSPNRKLPNWNNIALAAGGGTLLTGAGVHTLRGSSALKEYKRISEELHLYKLKNMAQNKRLNTLKLCETGMNNALEKLHRVDHSVEYQLESRIFQIQEARNNSQVSDESNDSEDYDDDYDEYSEDDEKVKKPCKKNDGERIRKLAKDEQLEEKKEDKPAIEDKAQDNKPLEKETVNQDIKNA